MDLALQLLCALALCDLTLGLNRSAIPVSPCRQEGCPNITLYLGPRWGRKVIYLEPESKNFSQNATEQEIPVQVEPDSLGNDFPPITHFTFPPTITKAPNSVKNTSGNTTYGTGAKPTSVKDTVESPLSDILLTPLPDEGIEEFDFFEPKPTSIYDVDSESEESLDYLQHRNELRKPVPDDGSYSIDVEQPEWKVDNVDVVRALPNSPDFLGGLDWSGYQLTGKQVKTALYNLTPFARARLRSLDISSNLIRNLEPLTFPSELEYTLEQLQLDDNPLQYLSSSSRFELSRLQRLKVLSLSHTSLRSFPPLLLPSLETLYLRGNLLSEVPDTLPSIPTLTELDLSDNWISMINDPITLPHLRILMLSNNSINYIDKEVFSECHDLQQVYLQHNMLTCAPPEMFESPAIFYLKNNPLDDHLAGMLGYDGAVTKPFCSSCPGLPSWVYSFTLNSSLLLVSMLVLLLAALAIRSKLTRLPPYRILEKSLV